MNYPQMKTILIFAFALFVSGLSAQISLKKLKNAIKGGSPTTEEVAEGLKEALTNGVSKGSDLASKLDGYYKNPEIKIPFPPDVKHVETKLRQIGMGSQVDRFIESLNRGAEDAAKEAKPIFISAVKQMTIQDAWSILKGEQDAATQYLKKTTTPQLTEKFMPVIKASLEKVNATKYYSELVTAYNKIPLVQKVNPNLDEYATGKAIDGLFILVAQEEKNIRTNPLARTSDLLKKVFSNQ
jgi:hypothetical protein